jgi:hypothetical protein
LRRKCNNQTVLSTEQAFYIAATVEDALNDHIGASNPVEDYVISDR